MSSAALNFVLDDPNGAADYIEELEAALREIAELSIEHGVAVYIARAALAKGQDK